MCAALITLLLLFAAAAPTGAAGQRPGRSRTRGQRARGKGGSARGGSGHGGQPQQPGVNVQVHEAKLSRYDFFELQEMMEGLMEAALGPEVAYWRTRGVTCEEVADTVARLHNVAPDTVRVVLIRNNTWRFLMPARRPSGIERAGGGGDGAWTSTAANLAAGDAAGDSVGRSGATDSSSGSSSNSGRTSSSSRTSRSSSSSSRQGAAVGRRYPWPRLVPEPLGECASPCHGQLRALHSAISGRLHARWAAKRYDLPDMVLLLNTADNMQRYGLHSRAPILSLQKWWRVPWWANSSASGSSNGGSTAGIAGGPAATAVTLGRIGGVLLQPQPLPRNVAAAVAAAVRGSDVEEAVLRGLGIAGSSSDGSSSSSRTTGAGGAAAAAADDDPLWKMVRRFVASRPPDLPQGVTAPDRRAAPPPPGPPPPSPPSHHNNGIDNGNDLYGSSNGMEPPPPLPEYDMDLLLPTMAFSPRSLTFAPWRKKKDVAFFSGVPYCPDYPTPHAACPRVVLAHLSHLARALNRTNTHPAPGHDRGRAAATSTAATSTTPHPHAPPSGLPHWGRLHPHPAAAVSAAAGSLDVRLVRPYTHKPLGSRSPFELNVTLPAHPPTPISEHGRYRWLLNVDGLAGSSRMGLLMTTDSAILKSRSPFIEYYSRLQTPGSHYLEFWSNASDPYDVLAVLAAARAAAKADPAAVAAAAAANQAIAARYLSMQAKMLYARAALLAYHSLVPDMGGCVRDLVERLEEEGEQQQ